MIIECVSRKSYRYDNEASTFSESIEISALYFVHAIVFKTSGECLYCIRNPKYEPSIPYFVSESYFRIISQDIPPGYAVKISPRSYEFHCLIAPDFWVKDENFFEDLMDSNRKEIDRPRKLFEDHVVKVKDWLKKEDAAIII